MATPYSSQSLDQSDSEDDELYLLAAQQYEHSLEYPISPATEAKYEEMDEDEFLLDNLLPPEEKYKGGSLPPEDGGRLEEHGRLLPPKEHDKKGSRFVSGVIL